MNQMHHFIHTAKRIILATSLILMSAVSMAQWFQVPSPNMNGNQNFLREIHGSSDNNIWAVGHYQDDDGKYMNLIIHWDGTEWSLQDPPNPSLSWNDLWAVVATGEDDAWAVGVYNPLGGASQMEILHYSGADWELTDSPTIPGGSMLNGIMAFGPDDIWAVGFRSPEQITIGPELALFMHFDGSDWEVIPVPPVGTRQNYFNDIDGLTPDDLWAVGYWGNSLGDFRHLVMRYDGNSWEHIPTPSGMPIGQLTDVEVIADDNVWVTGNYLTGGIVTMHWDGNDWTLFEGSGFVNELAVVHPWEVWGLGNAITLWNGSEWETVDDLSDFNNVFLNGSYVSESTAWAIGRHSPTNGAFQTLVMNMEFPSTGLAEEKENSIEPVHLSGNEPNPVDATTTIGFHVNEPGRVALHVYSITGRKMIESDLGYFESGSQNVRYSPDLSQGVYLYYLVSSGRQSDTKKLIMR